MNNITVISCGDNDHNAFATDIASTLNSIGYLASHLSIKTFLSSANHQTPLSIFALDTFFSDEKTDDLCAIKKILQCSDTVNIGVICKEKNKSHAEIFSLFHDILFWPCSTEEIQTRLKRFAKLHQDSNRKDVFLEQFSGLNLIGESSGFVDTLSLIQKISQCHAPVLIRGETGTGKENAARAIHYLGDRREHGFIPINCAAIPDELFESELFGHEKGAFTDAKNSQVGLVALADGGTLFLDEVDSLTPKAQAALLRFLQTHEYRPLGARDTRHADVRILAATNADLSERVNQKQFREDLFYRLNVLNLLMPPLRHRTGDIPLIAHALLQRFSQEYRTPPKQLSAQLIHHLMQQPWPGNVRELENTLLRAFLLSSDTVLNLTSDRNPPTCNTHTTSLFEDRFHAVSAQLSFQDAKAEVINQFEEHYLKQVLSIAEGNVSAAARIAGKERRALGKLIRKYRIDKSVYQSIPA